MTWLDRLLSFVAGATFTVIGAVGLAALRAQAVQPPATPAVSCVSPFDLTKATKACDAFCGLKPAKWVTDGSTLTCACDHLPNVGVRKVPAPPKPKKEPADGN